VKRALRVVALGSQEFSYSQAIKTRARISLLSTTVVATCVANEVDPLAYLTDILNAPGLDAG